VVFYSKKTAVSAEDHEQGYGRTWVWTALDPVSKLIISHLTGERTLEYCRCFIKDLASRLKNKPLFTSDELPHYADALLEQYHTVVKPEATGKPGRPRKPRKVVDPDLDYAVVHKLRKGNRLVKVERRIVYGDPQRIEERLAKSPSVKINTSYIERSNGTLRQHNGNLHRKSLFFAKEGDSFESRINITIAYYNFVKPHSALSKNPDGTTTPRTPAQVAGLVGSPWSVNYLLTRPELSQ
jgi:IS1 family transposase